MTPKPGRIGNRMTDSQASYIATHDTVGDYGGSLDYARLADLTNRLDPLDVVAFLSAIRPALHTAYAADPQTVTTMLLEIIE